MPIQLYKEKPKPKKAGGFDPIPQIEDENPPLGAQTGSEHLMPYLMKYVLENKVRLGILEEL